MGLSVAMITPWGRNTRCGIKTYSENLVGALAKLDVDVYVVRLPRYGMKTSELLQLVVDKIPVDKVDLLHIQYEGGLYQNLEGGFFGALKRLGKPIVTTCHNVGNILADSVIGDASDRIIVHNMFCRRHFQGDRSKVTVIAHGCQPTECPPMEECKKVLGIDPRVPIVGYLGFVSPVKGLETLVEAMRGVSEAALLIGGGWFTGRETSYIIDLKRWSLQVLPGRCQWLGYVPDERLATAYGAMDLLVYPSRHATESGALLTGLAHGRPTIASALPPFKEKEKKGALITFKNVEDLRRKIRRLLKDEGLRLKLAEGAMAYAESVKWYPTVAERHIRLYREVIKRCGGSA